MKQHIRRLRLILADWTEPKVTEVQRADIDALEWAIDQLRWRRVDDELPEPGFFDKHPNVGIEWLLYYSISGDPVMEVETKHHGLPDEYTQSALAWRPIDITSLPVEAANE